MKIKVSEATPTQLDWLVAKCEENDDFALELRASGYKRNVPFMKDVSPSSAGGGFWPKYSSDWRQGGPIIEREQLSIGHELNDGPWVSFSMNGCRCEGDAPLIAAMRCHVASKLGDEVDVPDELG